MSEEILKFKGRLHEAELEARQRDITIKGLVESLRNLLDPFEPSRDLKDEQILDQAIRLSDSVIQLRAELAHIGELKRALGRN